MNSKDEVKLAKVLICIPYFYPSLGGAENVALHLGRHLIGRKYQVDVLTGKLADRKDYGHLGIRILEHSGHPSDTSRWRIYQKEIRQRIVSGEYSSCVMFVDPENWILGSLKEIRIPEGVRVIVQPLINEDSFSRWRNNPSVVGQVNKAFERVDASVVTSRTGVDALISRRMGVQLVYIPNAVSDTEGTPGFRERYRLGRNTFMLLHVANFWKVKNHDGMLTVFSKISHDWKLVLVGYPANDLAYYTQIQQLAAKDPRVLLIPGLPPEEISSAMEDCDVVLLTSHGEVSPLVVLEAMRRKKPWLATPSCGNVHEMAGGLIALLDRFPVLLEMLFEDEKLRGQLGEAGWSHWESCFRSDRVGAAWCNVLKPDGSRDSFSMPEKTWMDMGRIWQTFLPYERPEWCELQEYEGVSWCVITNGKRRCELEMLIASIHAMRLPYYEILVGGDVPEGLDRVKKIPLVEYAHKGYLGRMRNRLCDHAAYPLRVLTDDDMFFNREFLVSMPRYLKDYDALTARVVNPDGSRYWDWCEKTPDGRVHRLLPYDETSPYAYLSGSVCVTKATVTQRIKWNEDTTFYEEEDVDFSRRLIRMGYRIGVNSEAEILHQDDRYTQAGDVVVRGTELPWKELFNTARELRSKGQRNSAARVLRFVIEKPDMSFRGRIRCMWLAIRLKDRRSARAFLQKSRRPSRKGNGSGR